MIWALRLVALAGVLIVGVGAYYSIKALLLWSLPAALLVITVFGVALYVTLLALMTWDNGSNGD